MRAFNPKFIQSPALAIGGFAGLFILLIAMRFLGDLRARYDAAIEATKRSASDYAELLAEDTQRAFEAVDHALREAELIRLNVKSSHQSDADRSLEDANQMLRHLQQTSPLLVSIGWTNAQGELEAHYNTGAPGRHNLADAEHFIVPRDSGSPGLYIARPFRSIVNGNWLIAASRRITNPDGSFAGIVGAVLDQSYFSGIYRAVRIGSHGIVAVINRNGTVLVREPMDQHVFEQSFLRTPLFAVHLQQSDSGAFEGTNPFDWSGRVVAYHAVAGLPLVVSVSYAKDDVLEAWYHHLYTYGPLTAIVLSVFGFGAFLLIRQTRKVANKNAILELTLENMAHGLCMYDGAQRLIVSNKRYADMYGLDAELIKPGTPLRPILEARAGSAENTSVGDYAGRYLEDLARKEPFHSIDRLRDGRVIAISHQPIQGGGWVVIHQDITERLRDEEQVAFMARHDLLTGVSNRAAFLERLGDAVARLRRRHECFTVFMLDLDRFKKVNDLFGHPAGDALLKEISGRLRSMLRETDVIARLGGDEFAIIQSGQPHQRTAAVVVATRIVDGLSEPFEICGKMVNVGVSVGIALAPADGADADPLMMKADIALYRAKEEGRNCYRFFDEQMTAEAESRRQLEHDLQAAICANEIEVRYQPIFEVKSRKLYSVEALARWYHPVKGEILPSIFIPLAEQCGLIDKLGRIVLRKACSDAMSWPAAIKVAVNISPSQFHRSNVLNVILNALLETGLPPQRLELEVTETTLLANEADHIADMHRLKELGVSISLDDFGTGYSSLSYLTMFPFDKIKIDRSFTTQLIKRADCAAIVSSVLALAQGLDLATVAEGVEDEQQFDILRAAGVHFAQGFLLGQPCRSSELSFHDCWDGDCDLRTLGKAELENVA